MRTDSRSIENAAAPELPGDHSEASADGEQINILLVDDEPKNLTVLKSVLDDPKYRLVLAGSADEALMELVRQEFALLVLDIQMPEMNGFELAQMVKQRKKTAGIPIIFLTAYYSEDEHVLEGYGSGAVDFLHKPINPAILRSKVAVFADLHVKSRELGSANRALLEEVAEHRRAREELRQLTLQLEQRVADRTADLKQADRRKDEFLATLAHELRNPLAPICNAVQVLHLKGTEQGALQWATEVIERQARQMTRLVDDLLDVSRITTGKLVLRREHVELGQIVQAAVETSGPLIQQCGQQLVVVPPSERVVLNADLTRLAQVLSNLLNNAARYTEPGGQIELRSCRRGDEAVVSVKDTGVGISAEMLPHVFEMFNQGERHLERSRGGLGVGLTLVRRLVELHGGTIEARSEGAGAGSEFIVSLPVVTQAESAEPDPETDRATVLSSRLRILVADDNQDSAESLRMLLRLMGHDIRVAHDGQAAIETAEVFRPDVVLLDIGMPKLNGYEACRRIREQAWGAEILLIAQSGWGQEEDRRRTREAGFDHHLVKPVDQNVLMKALADSSTGRERVLRWQRSSVQS